MAQAGEVIIESHSISNATWGEMIAEQLRAKHIVYLLSEKNTIRSKSVFEFLHGKLLRKELYGIQKQSLKSMFSRWIDLDEADDHYMIATNDNVICDDHYPYLSTLPNSDFTIGSIGRLNKLFVRQVVEDLFDFCQSYVQYDFKIIFIGGEPKGSKSRREIIDKLEVLKMCIFTLQDTFIQFP